MHILKYIAFLCILLSLCAFAGEKDSVVISGSYKVKVDSIRITGNAITKDFIIRRELNFKEGDTLTTETAAFNRDRVYSLSLFGVVDIIPYQFDNHITAYVIVEESWYIWPIPFAELKDKDWDKISYGMDLEIKNLFGYNQRLRARVALGYDPSYYLFYRNPVVGSSNKYLLISELSYQTVSNKSKYADSAAGKTFKQKIITGLAGLGYRLSLYENASVTAGFAYVETPFYIKGISASDSRFDRIFMLAGAYSYDTRDLALFPKKGILAAGNITFRGLGINNINYQILNLDMRGYTEMLSGLYGKVRLTSRNTFGKVIPYYDHSYIGYGERVRGNSNNVMEGNHSYLFSAETFTQIVNDFTVNLHWVPVLPKSLLTYRVALYAHAFGDAGIALFDQETLAFNKFSRGYGIGLTLLILPYNIFRVEFAVNEKRHSEILVDLGISF